MKMRIIGSLLLLGLMSVPMFAQESSALNAFRRGEVAYDLFSFNRQGTLNLYGGDLSLTVHPKPGFGIVMDFGAHRSAEYFQIVSGILVGTKADVLTYRFGPQFSMTPNKRTTVFTRVLAGGAQIKASGRTNVAGRIYNVDITENGFAMAVGGGVDIATRQWMAIRAVQVDYSLLQFSSTNDLAIGTSNGVRIGAGLVFRFGK